MAVALQVLSGIDDKLLIQERDTLAKVLLHILSQIVAGNLPQGEPVSNSFHWLRVTAYICFT